MPADPRNAASNYLTVTNRHMPMKKCGLPVMMSGQKHATRYLPAGMFQRRSCDVRGEITPEPASPRSTHDGLPRAPDLMNLRTCLRVVFILTCCISTKCGWSLWL